MESAMIESDRVLATGAKTEDEAYERAVRPKTLHDYVGQAPVKAQLEIFITAARNRGDALASSRVNHSSEAP
jgi:Holliday junction DNA helicase RuvB